MGAFLKGEERGGGGAYLIYSIVQKEPKYKVEKLKYKNLGSCSRGSKTNLNFQLVNKPSWSSPHEVLQSWLINTVYHLLDKNNKGEVRVLIGDRRHIWEGALIEDLHVLIFIFTCDSSWQWKWGIQWHSLFCNIVFRTMLMIHLLISVQPKTKWMAIMKMRLFEWHYMYFALLLCLYIISART